MNRILFEQSEIKDGAAAVSGDRAAHIVNILHSEVGDRLRTGEIDGLIGESEVTGIDGGMVRLKVHHTRESLKPWADLILAPPRPRVMKRLLPQLAALGVGRIVLVGAKKVEKDFWGATLLKEENFRPLLIEGLMQSGTSIMPEVLARKSFRRFLADELDAIFPDSRRIVAHPYECETPGDAKSPAKRRPLFAIGPESGWTDGEIALLLEKGFTPCTLGRRILRTETAAISLLARFMMEYEQ